MMSLAEQIAERLAKVKAEHAEFLKIAAQQDAIYTGRIYELQSWLDQLNAPEAETSVPDLDAASAPEVETSASEE